MEREGTTAALLLIYVARIYCPRTYFSARKTTLLTNTHTDKNTEVGTA